MNTIQLQSDKVHQTIERLLLRIHERFPDSSLYNVCNQLLTISKDTQKTIKQISKPHYILRAFAILFSLFLLAILATLFFSVKISTDITAFDLIQTMEAGTNELIFLSIAIYFFWSLELRSKRRRVIQAMNKLRNLAHIIDMHQLTKDPDSTKRIYQPTKNSPKHTLSSYELSRYLDYCSEMLSLLSKLGYLYISQFDDPEATKAAYNLENLSSGLSRKIWQKIMILHPDSNGKTS
jgi:hypothetical protein